MFNVKRLITYRKIRRAFSTLVQEGFLCLLEKVQREIRLLNAYNIWIKQNENSDIGYQKNVKFVYMPKISIITATFNTPTGILQDAIDSVLSQTYSNWELCIADGNSNAAVRNMLKQFSEKDSRIKVVFLEKNKGIAGNLNEGLKISNGDFTGFLDHDDELHPSALYEVVKLLNSNRNIDFIYTDEDKISVSGKRFAPHFKPDWSPDAFRSLNYICHFAVIRQSVIDEICGFRGEYEGSQDYDLFLRVSEKTEKIAHIPKVLYHWRAHQNSAASDARVKMYAYESARKALHDHIQRVGLKGEVSFGHFLGSYRIKYKIEDNPPVAVIIPNKDKPEMLKKCVTSVLNKSSYENYKIFIVDNRSKKEETLACYKKLRDNSKIKILNYDKPFNFAAINNYAVSCVESEYLLFLNNDTEVISPSWIESMLEFAQRSEVGAVGAKLYFSNNTIQHAGVIIWENIVPSHAFRYFHRTQTGYMGRAAIIQNYSAVTAACMMTKKSVFDDIGGFDANFAFCYNDVDFCLKIREKGRLIVWTPYAELYHYESRTRGSNTIKTSQHKKEAELLRKKWESFLEKGDPCYNPNLSSKREDFSLNIK